MINRRKLFGVVAGAMTAAVVAPAVASLPDERKYYTLIVENDRQRIGVLHLHKNDLTFDLLDRIIRESWLVGYWTVRFQMPIGLMNQLFLLELRAKKSFEYTNLPDGRSVPAYRGVPIIRNDRLQS